MYVVKRHEHNPILTPNRDHYWEEFATFNLCPVKKGDIIYGLYRSISAIDRLRIPNQISVIGAGESTDGIHFKKRRQLIEPKEEWDKFGCEDPRATYFEGKFYIFYTALSKYPFGPEGIKVAVATSKDMKHIEERHFITPFNAKAMALFPERVNGKMTVIFSIDTDNPPAKLAIVQLPKDKDLYDTKFWAKVYKNIDKHTIDPRRNEYDHVEVGAPPVRTELGWLLVYSHIQNYFQGEGNQNQDRIFGIEALLLDLKDPKKIMGRTRGPMLVPSETYELSGGYVPNVIFPSGALIDGDTLNVYYGAADTTGCVARVNLKDLLYSMHNEYCDEYRFKRVMNNPIIMPKKDNDWEALATFNPTAIRIKNKTYILYRAMSHNNTSTIGLAISENGVDITERLPEPIYVPREDFENKKVPNGNSGCEDARITKIGKNLYICYTAYDSIGPPRVAISHISEKDFLARKWDAWSKPALITPRDLDDKDACILPTKLPDGYMIMHRVSGEICGDYVGTLDFKKEKLKKCIRILGPRPNTWDSSKVGIAGPPIKTDKGWLLFYHGVSRSHNTYRVGVALLDLKDPAIVLARSTEPILEPEEQYEKSGVVPNVVFPCGAIEIDGVMYLYYGGADKVTAVATMKLDIILDALLNVKGY